MEFNCIICNKECRGKRCKKCYLSIFFGKNQKGENNHMYGKIPHNKGKTKENYEPLRRVSEKVSKTKKRLYSEGKIKIWNKNLTKEMDIRVKESGKKCSLTKKQMYKNGELKVWSKDKNHPKYKNFIQIVTEIGKNNKGENNPNFNNWSSKEPYSKDWTKGLKEKIRHRDNFKCQECNQTEEQLGYKLSIHHIDYNKKNCNENNLITLCKSCHAQTNFNRNDWKKYFQEKLKW